MHYSDLNYIGCVFLPKQYVSALLLCFWPPVHAVCLNHKVVAFQPHIVTAQYLGYVSNIANILASHPTCSNCVMDIRFPLPPDISPIAPPSFTHQRRFCLSFLLLLSPPSCPGMERPTTWTAPPPAGLHRSSVISSLDGIPQGVP